MNSKQIGNIGEAKTIYQFIKFGIPVYIPFGDNEKADLIAEFNGKLNKIQVKTSQKAENGKMIFDLTSSTSHRKNGIKHSYNKEEIDFFVCYNIERDKLFLIPIEQAPKSAITIRYEYPKNNQIKGIQFENDLLFDNIIKNYL